MGFYIADSVANAPLILKASPPNTPSCPCYAPLPTLYFDTAWTTLLSCCCHLDVVIILQCFACTLRRRWHRATSSHCYAPYCCFLALLLWQACKILIKLQETAREVNHPIIDP